MKSLNSVLPLLAALLAALLAFQLGSRFGSAQAGAYALGGQLDYLVRLGSQEGVRMDPEPQAAFLESIDYLTASAAEQRTRWFLGRQTRGLLDGAVARSLALRWPAILERFEPSAEQVEELESAGLIDDREGYLERLGALREAVENAHAQLVTESPSE